MNEIIFAVMGLFAIGVHIMAYGPRFSVVDDEEEDYGTDPWYQPTPTYDSGGAYGENLDDSEYEHESKWM